MSSVCQYNQFGHCKFGTRCEKFHTTETCDSFPCVNRECDKRHPKLCQYFAVYGWCRFAGNCSFLHYDASRCVHTSTSSTSQGLQEVMQAMSELKNEIKTLRFEVDRLERQNQNLFESRWTRMARLPVRSGSLIASTGSDSYRTTETQRSAPERRKFVRDSSARSRRNRRLPTLSLGGVGGASRTQGRLNSRFFKGCVP